MINQPLPSSTGAVRIFVAVTLLGCCALWCVGGCNVIGFVASKAAPPPRAPAQYELGKAPTAVVVSVDTGISGEYGPADAETLAIALERSLEQRGTRIVDESAASRIVRVKLNPPSAHTAMGSEYHSGQASALVRVVANTGTEVWPRDGSEGSLVEAQTPRVRASDPGEVRRATLQALGQSVAALFHSREMRADE